MAQKRPSATDRERIGVARDEILRDAEIAHRLVDRDQNRGGGALRRSVVQAFAVGIRNQERRSVPSPAFELRLEGVIGSEPAILNRADGAPLRIASTVVNRARAW